MTKPEIIEFIKSNGSYKIEFGDPILIKLSPYDIGIRAYGLEIADGDLWIRQDGGKVFWDYASLPVRNSIVQRLRLMIAESKNAFHH